MTKGFSFALLDPGRCPGLHCSSPLGCLTNTNTNRACSASWAKETRIRIFAEDFEPIGYYFRFKQDAFQALLEENRKRSRSTGHFCNPKAKKVSAKAKKPPHEDEGDDRLPPEIRGCHFNAYFRICKRLGCKQGKKPPQMEFFEDEELA